MSKPDLIFSHDDIGFSCFYFKAKIEGYNKPFLYCFMDDGYNGQPDFKFMRCSLDGEPQNEADVSKFNLIIPEGLNTENEFIKSFINHLKEIKQND